MLLSEPLAKNNIFQDSFNKILSQKLTHDRSYILDIADPRSDCILFWIAETDLGRYFFGDASSLSQSSSRFYVSAVKVF